MNMCLLEVAMCEKCSSSHLQLEGGSKMFEDRGEGYQFGGGGTFAVRLVPHYMPWFFPIGHNCVTECMLWAKFLLKLF